MPELGHKLPITEIFGPVYQGEGSVIGQQTTFIRFFGCDSRCQMCDSMHSVDGEVAKREGYKVEKLTVEEIIQRVLACGSLVPTVTLSGGNPALYDLDDLIDYLHMTGKKVTLETQGTLLQEWFTKVDTFCLSPKGPGMNDLKKGILSPSDVVNLLRYISLRGPTPTLKVVVFDERDVDYLEEIISMLIGVRCFICAQPGNSDVTKKNEGPLSIAAHKLAQETIALQLLHQYRWMCDQFIKHPVLSRVTLLPQLHVLAYGNERGK